MKIDKQDIQIIKELYVISTEIKKERKIELISKAVKIPLSIIQEVIDGKYEA